MIDVRQAVQIAKAKATEMLFATSPSLEEIERESYKDRDVWSITLGIPRQFNDQGPLGQLSALSEDKQYKRFLIDAETGEFLAMKLREAAYR